MPTLTTNLSLKKPLVNSATDQDVWGDQLNEDLDTLDSEAATWTINKSAANFALSNVNLKRAYTTPYNAGNLTGAVTLDYANGNLQYGTATGNITSLTINNFPDGGSMTLEITQDGTGSRTLTYDTATYKTAGGVAFVLSTGVGDIDDLYFRKRGSIIKLSGAKDWS